MKGEGWSYPNLVTLTTEVKIIIIYIGTCWLGIDENDGCIINHNFNIKSILQSKKTLVTIFTIGSFGFHATTAFKGRNKRNNMSFRNGILKMLAISLFVNAVQTVKAADTNVATSTLSLGAPEVSLLKTSAGVINLSLLQRDAGMSIETSKSDSTSRLLVSSVIRTTNRTLSAKITSGTIPTGTILKLQAKQPNASFIGTAGTLGVEVTLDATDRPVVSNIGTCYSGTAASDGFPLRFTYALDTNTSTYSSLRANSGVQIIVTLTLSPAQ